MNPNWLGIASAVLAFVAFFLTYRVAVKRGVKERMGFSMLAVVLAIPGASLAAYYAHLLPERSWYYEFRSLPGTEFLVVFVGIAGGLIASLLPRVVLVLPLLGVAAFSITPILKPLVGPIPAGTLSNAWDGEICLQSTPATCGAASVATIMRSLGVRATESELAAEAHSYLGGTEAWYLARSVRSRGLDARFLFSSEFDPDMELPAVVGVRLGTIGHFIPILKREDAKFLIGDPLRGREWLSRDELLGRYDFTGFNLLIERGE